MNSVSESFWKPSLPCGLVDESPEQRPALLVEPLRVRESMLVAGNIPNQQTAAWHHAVRFPVEERAKRDGVLRARAPFECYRARGGRNARMWDNEQF